MDLKREIDSIKIIDHHCHAMDVFYWKDAIGTPPPFPPHIQRVHQRIIDPLVAAIANQNPQVRRASIRLFVALEIGPAGAAAQPHLRSALETGDIATRRLADKALKQIQAPAATN